MDSTPAPALPSGFKSSEFSLSTLVALVGSAIAVASMVVGTAQDSGLQLPPWVRAVGVGLGLASAVVAKLGYTKSRTVLKTEQLRATVSPMLPQILQLVNQVVDVVKDIKAGGLTAPADAGDPSSAPTPAGVAPKLLAAAELAKAALPEHPIADQLTSLALQVAGAVGGAAADQIKSDKQAVAELNEKA